MRLVELADPEIAAQPQDVVQRVRVGGERPQRRLDLRERVGVEQRPELLLPEQLRSRSRSSESACARRSAGGVSSSYMYVAM